MTFVRTPVRRARPTAPAGPWQWTQRWSDLLFLHWRVAPEALRPLVPAALDLDIWDGMPWVSLVGFRLDVRQRSLPSFGLTKNIIELNLRTYVVHDGVPGIYFLSIHADSRLTVALARLLTPLPYVHARMAYEGTGKNRFWCQGPREQVRLEVESTPCGNAERARPNSRGEWLLERYVLYAVNRHGKLLRTIAEHPPWIYENVTCECSENSMGDALGLDLHRKQDCAHFSAGVDACLWPFGVLSSQF